MTAITLAPLLDLGQVRRRGSPPHLLSRPGTARTKFQGFHFLCVVFKLGHADLCDLGTDVGVAQAAADELGGE